MKRFVAYLFFFITSLLYAEAQCYKHVVEFHYDDNGNRISRTYHVINPCRSSLIEDEFIQLEQDFDTAQHTFNVFPNPTNGRFTVEIFPADHELPRDLEILLMDASGKAIYRTPILDYQTFFDIINMPDGIFMIGILNGSNIVSSFKIIKI